MSEKSASSGTSEKPSGIKPPTKPSGLKAPSTKSVVVAESPQPKISRLCCENHEKKPELPDAATPRKSEYFELIKRLVRRTQKSATI